jgi:hypothetical protein
MFCVTQLYILVEFYSCFLFPSKIFIVFLRFPRDSQDSDGIPGIFTGFGIPGIRRFPLETSPIRYRDFLNYFVIHCRHEVELVAFLGFFDFLGFRVSLDFVGFIGFFGFFGFLGFLGFFGFFGII